MLAVARRKSEEIEWIEGPAEALPLSDQDFDAVVSQFGLMFFRDPAAALGEMWRVLRPDGRLAVAVCDVVENSPGYAAFASLLDSQFGKSVGDSFRAPFVLGDSSRLLEISRQAGIAGATVSRHSGHVAFKSVASLISAERAWSLGALLDDEQFSKLSSSAEEALKPFVSLDGTVMFEMPTLILTARRPA